MKSRPKELLGRTIRVQTGFGKLYITTNEYDKKLVEVFAIVGKSGKEINAMTEAVGRMISLNLRNKVSVEDIIRQLRGISGEAPTASGTALIASIPDAIAQVLEEYYGKGKEHNTTTKGDDKRTT